MNFLTQPFVSLLVWLCEIFKSYPIAIIVFTVVLNVVLSPLNIKQQKTMAKQAKLKPKLEALKEKCGDDKMKYQNAMTELYQKENVSPTGGCLPMFIRLAIIMIVYSALRTVLNSPDGRTIGDNVLVPLEYFDLFGLNIAPAPKFSTDIINDFQLLWLIPLASFATQLLSMFISNAQQKKNNPQADMGGAMKGTMLIMPLFSLYITFQFTCALGFYWAISGVVNTVITVVVNSIYSADKINAKELLEQGKQRREKEQAIKRAAE